MKLIPRKKAQPAGEVARTNEVFSTIQSEMDQLFDRFFRGDWEAPLSLFGGRAGWGPSVDVADGEKEVVVKADIPGVEPRDLDISISGSTLTIAGEKKEVHEDKGKDYYRSERHVGSFRRAVELPSTVDSEKVNAEYKNGVLTIRLEKVQSARPRKIAVR